MRYTKCINEDEEKRMFVHFIYLNSMQYILFYVSLGWLIEEGSLEIEGTNDFKTKGLQEVKAKQTITMNDLEHIQGKPRKWSKSFFKQSMP